MGAKKSGFYRRLVLDLLSRMTQGRLCLTLPEGDTVVFGTGPESGEVSARVIREDFFSKCVLYGDVGFGEAYVDGDWDSGDPAGVISWMILNVENHPTLMNSGKKRLAVNFLGFLNALRHHSRSNKVSNSRKNISQHYDLGNDFFALFLDRGMTYSSALFSAGTETLEEAQEKKFEALSRKLRLSENDHVLEIGGGWGGFAEHAVRRHGCRVTTITLSKEQLRYMQERFRRSGSAARIEPRLVDYRHVEGRYDKIVSIEMIEAVGHEHLGAYFAQCHRLLKPAGLLGLQAILAPDHRYESFRQRPDWIQKHIFPGGLLPSFEAILSAVRRTGDLGLLDYDDMTPSYAKTLALWRRRFMEASDDVRKMGFPGSFSRKWNYYFCYCEAAFRMRNISVIQAVFSRPNNGLLVGENFL